MSWGHQCPQSNPFAAKTDVKSPEVTGWSEPSRAPTSETNLCHANDSPQPPRNRHSKVNLCILLLITCLAGAYSTASSCHNAERKTCTNMCMAFGCWPTSSHCAVLTTLSQKTPRHHAVWSMHAVHAPGYEVVGQALVRNQMGSRLSQSKAKFLCSARQLLQLAVQTKDQRDLASTARGLHRCERTQTLSPTGAEWHSSLKRTPHSTPGHPQQYKDAITEQPSFLQLYNRDSRPPSTCHASYRPCQCSD